MDLNQTVDVLVAQSLCFLETHCDGFLFGVEGLARLNDLMDVMFKKVYKGVHEIKIKTSDIKDMDRVLTRYRIKVSTIFDDTIQVMRTLESDGTHQMFVEDKLLQMKHWLFSYMFMSFDPCLMCEKEDCPAYVPVNQD